MTNEMQFQLKEKLCFMSVLKKVKKNMKKNNSSIMNKRFSNTFQMKNPPSFSLPSLCCKLCIESCLI